MTEHCTGASEVLEQYCMKPKKSLCKGFTLTKTYKGLTNEVYKSSSDHLYHGEHCDPLTVSPPYGRMCKRASRKRDLFFDIV